MSFQAASPFVAAASFRDGAEDGTNDVVAEYCTRCHSERMRRPGDEEFLAEKKKAPLVMALGTISTPQGTVKFRKRLQ